jgi:hypothetical protein
MAQGWDDRADVGANERAQPFGTRASPPGSARANARAQVEWLLTVHDHYAAQATGPDGQNDNNLTC